MIKIQRIYEFSGRIKKNDWKMCLTEFEFSMDDHDIKIEIFLFLWCFEVFMFK